MTRPLVEVLQRQNLSGLSLLDIGGGIGAIIFELLQSGVQQAVNVEISRAYLDAFEKEATRRGLSGQIQSYSGDFLHLAPQLEVADIVTLDKVICCYPDYEALVRLSLSKCRKYYACVLPRDVWWVHAGEWLKSWERRLKGKPFATYIHPVEAIEQMVLAAGFRKIGQQHRKEWRIAVFEKK